MVLKPRAKSCSIGTFYKTWLRGGEVYFGNLFESVRNFSFGTRVRQSKHREVVGELTQRADANVGDPKNYGYVFQAGS
jgi:hypothetical protein